MISVTYVATTDMTADGLTKPLTHAKLHGLVQQMGMASERWKFVKGAIRH